MYDRNLEAHRDPSRTIQAISDDTRSVDRIVHPKAPQLRSRGHDQPRVRGPLESVDRLVAVTNACTEHYAETRFYKEGEPPLG